MKVCAVVCEYNPFHNGHKYHIMKTYEHDVTHIVAIMSGDFVQRGEPAMFSKYARAKMALMNGVDLVLELPSIYAMTGAERFSQSAVSIIKGLGCVNSISFGCESANLENLDLICDCFERIEFRKLLSEKLSLGMTFAKARYEAISEILSESIAQMLLNPNDILALEYVKAMHKIKSDLCPIIIKRDGAKHDSNIVSREIASSSHIRKLLREKNAQYERYVPNSVIDIMNEEFEKSYAPADIGLIDRAVIARLRTMSRYDLQQLPDISEGLDNKILKSVAEATSLTELINMIKSKRYTHARIRRIILSAFLGIKKENIDISPPYIKVLGFNKKGIDILKLSKNKATLPIITKASQINNCDAIVQKIFNLQSVCSDLYALCVPQIFHCGNDYRSFIVKI